MPNSIEIQPVTKPLAAEVRPPGSKSLTNRALVCAALARGSSHLTGVLDSEDTRVMVDALRTLGIAIDGDPAGESLRVVGCGGVIVSPGANVYVANSGTTVRFLTALVALGHGEFRLHGTSRMHQRPIADLLKALGDVQVQAVSEGGNGCPPVIVQAHGLSIGRAAIRGDTSSQFLSALLMVAPCAQASELGVEIHIEGPLVSQPYVTMTLEVMRAFGAHVEHDAGLSQFRIATSGYRACDYAIEPDASAASYFWAAAAIAGGQVRVTGLSRDSLQGDVGFCQALEQMGCRVRYEADAITVIGGALHGIEIDMNPISDTAQTLAVVALFATGKTTICGIGHIRHKETDRIAALVAELRKLGAEVEEKTDGLVIVPGPHRSATIATYDDHRMAMSFALAGLKIPGVAILDPDCTAKTYPGYWQNLAKVAP